MRKLMSFVRRSVLPVALLLAAFVLPAFAQPVSGQDDAGLEQLFVWRGLHLYTPFGYFLSAGFDELEAIAMTHEGRLEFSMTFEMKTLGISVRDFSAERESLAPEDVTTLDVVLHSPDDVLFEETLVGERNGFTIASADFEARFQEGRAVLVLSDDYAFLIVGQADADVWDDAYSDQFDAIIERVALGPAEFETETE